MSCICVFEALVRKGMRFVMMGSLPVRDLKRNEAKGTKTQAILPQQKQTKKQRKKEIRVETFSFLKGGLFTVIKLCCFRLSQEKQNLFSRSAVRENFNH